MHYFTFTAGLKQFAVDIKSIELIVPGFGLKPASQHLKHVRGVLEFRDEHVAVIDFNEYITGDPCKEKMHARIAVLRHDNKFLGLLAEFATDIIEGKKGSFQVIDVPHFFHTFKSIVEEENYVL